MNPKGNLVFAKGNKIACGNRGGGRKKADIARMLERFAPRVVKVIEKMLNAPDLRDRWTAAKELAPYLWPKKAAMAVTQEGEKVPSLADYLAARQNGGATTAAQPEPTGDDPRGDQGP